MLIRKFLERRSGLGTYKINVDICNEDGRKAAERMADVLRLRAFAITGLDLRSSQDASGTKSR